MGQERATTADVRRLARVVGDAVTEIRARRRLLPHRWQRPVEPAAPRHVEPIHDRDHGSE